MASSKLHTLILCTGNSARSQMAEGLLRHLGGEACTVESAGSRPGSVHPLAIRAMEERGLSLEGHRSKHVDELMDQSFDVVFTVCDHAADVCPTFPGDVERIHWSLPDPAAALGSDDEKLALFREVRNDLEERLRGWLESRGIDVRT